jgi:hypothetical protein
MDSAYTHKWIKARQYADEPERIHLRSLAVDFSGDDRPHRVAFEDERWSCDCEYFLGHGTCAHTMAVDRVFRSILDPLAV